VTTSPEPQVRLVPATEQLPHALTEDPAPFADLLGSPVPAGWPEFTEAIDFTLQHLRDAPERDRWWSMQLVVDAATGRLVGSGGYAAPPVGRTVEIGYVLAHTFPGPNPSTGVLLSLGFEHTDDEQDPEVGAVWEWRWTRPSERPGRGLDSGIRTPEDLT
jgi:ribosomal-protein-alanine N-acetyltransferase